MKSLLMRIIRQANIVGQDDSILQVACLLSYTVYNKPHCEKKNLFDRSEAENERVSLACTPCMSIADIRLRYLWFCDRKTASTVPATAIVMTITDKTHLQTTIMATFMHTRREETSMSSCQH